MSQKRNHLGGLKNCKCDKCGTESVSIPGRLHRRCPGQEGLPLRKKHDALASSEKGTWN